MKSKLVLITRILLGLIFFVFGGNGLVFFLTGKSMMPMPPPTGEMATVFAGFMATHYLMILVKALEVSAGALLLCNRYVNLALVLLAPIAVNILCLHVFAEPSGLPMAIAISVMLAIQFWARWDVFKPILNCK